MPDDHTTRPATDARTFAVEIAVLMRDLKCEDILVLDVHRLSQVTEFLVIGTGTSERQMGTVASDVQDLAGDTGHNLFRSTAERSSSWVVLDFVDVIVHLFEPNARSYYDLESLWIDAERVAWRQSASISSKTQKSNSKVE